ncbi:MAG: DUF6183 family protein, partial [Actinomycetota bacterium]
MGGLALPPLMIDPALLGPSELLDLVEAAEPNPLLRRVDSLCERRAWDDLVELARRCRQALERGKQLWPIAEHIDYRLALEAPPEYAASVLTPTAGRFAPGPLTEVAASTHSFDDLEPYLSLPSTAGVVAAERVLRGEDLMGRPQAHPEVLELPMRLQSWEPAYALATYRSREVEVASPELAPVGRETRATPSARIEDPELSAALLELVAAWVTGSNARAEVAVSEGPVAAAIGALGVESFRIGEMTSRQSLALMAWTGAGGGAHGRRRGAAAGRSTAWWSAAALCDLEWPPDPDALGEELSRLRWYRWEPLRLSGGWRLLLAVEAPAWG